VAHSPIARRILEIVSAKGVSPGAWSGILARMPVGDVEGMLASPEGRERLSRKLHRRVTEPDSAFVEEQLRRLDAGGYGLISILDEEYPALLREIQEPPPVLYYAGDLTALSRPALCVVGSRRATRRGLITARDFARDLSRLGIHVVSGLARGIDGAAHEGALGGPGGTTAVLGSGLDVLYPPEHRRLAERILESGCVVSEFPLGTEPFRYNFPRRNRILSGLSLGVVVVEAALESGAMGTAGWAADQGREVFAIPGPIDDPRSRGPHKLIRDGAHLVESPKEVAEILMGGKAGSSSRESAPGEEVCDEDSGARPPVTFPQLELCSEDERRVLETLSLDPKHIDELVQFCHISPAIILPILLDLEMRGVIVSCGSGAYALAAPAG
jgi:DNA processing protein